MSFSTPIALSTVLTAAAVLAGLAILAYVLKMRRRRFEVPFSTLWQRVLKEKETTSLFKQLKRLLSLLLQLTILTLLILAVLDPRLGEEDRDVRNVVLIIDASASMKSEDERPGGEDEVLADDSAARSDDPDDADDADDADDPGDADSADDPDGPDDTDSADDDGPRITRMEAAQRRARRLLDAMGGGDMAMIVRMDGQTTPLSRFDSDLAMLKRTVDGIEASDTPADLARALSAAADALRGRKNPMIVLIGDGAYPEQELARVVLNPPGGSADIAPSPDPDSAAAQAGAPGDDPAQAAGERLDAIDLRGIDVRFIPVGRDDDNVGIVAFNARRYLADKTSYAVFVEIQNFGSEPAGRRLVVYSGDSAVDVKSVTLAPGERLRQLYPNLGGGQGNRLRAELLPLSAPASEANDRDDTDDAPTSADTQARRPDRFPLDDRAFALLPARKKQTVLLVSEDNLYLEGAMLVYDNIQVDKLTPAEYDRQVKTGLGEYDAVVFDEHTPAELPPPPTHLLYFGPRGEHSPFPIRRVVPTPRVTETNDTHPVMRWVIMNDVNYDEAAVFAVGGAPGGGSDEVVLARYVRDPIAAAKRDGARKIAAFGFALDGTDLTLRVAFPLLLVNALDWFAGDDADLITTYQTGRRFRVPLDGLYGVSEVEVTLPGGRTTRAPVSDGYASFYGHTIGVHRLVAREGGQVVAGIELAANLANPGESNIAPRRELRMGGSVLAAPEGFRITARRSLWLYLALVVLGLLLVEWITYHRRITV
ncbi:VWA domain-containing protein [Haliangium sp.]|uniref:VWA domain-containing protein n=1 Tax=Haliangium sp. TaxID=2663208 RepID=UPI003D0AB652